MSKVVISILLVLCAMQYPVKAQQGRLCGEQMANAALVAADPDWANKIAAHKSSLQKIADDYRTLQATGASKTTTTAKIPVVFHIIVNTAQLAELGGMTGIIQRCNSQIDVLEADFNALNADSSMIPSGFKPAFASTGIHFGLAHLTPSGAWTPGFELKVISNDGFGDVSALCASAKYDTAGGFNSWDVRRYLNIWCIGFSGFSGLLGITTPKSKTGSGGRPLKEEGICIKYNALGKRASASDNYPAHFDLGRTLTHECGHFFEIWHTWGDDGGLCPWSGGADDGLADTPPESDATTGNPIYSVSGGTLFDGCKMNGSTVAQPYGKPCVNFMDYTDDIGMHMFTAEQAAVMATQVAPGGENDSLTIDPLLTRDPLGVSPVDLTTMLNLYPNPTEGILFISFDEASSQLQQVVVTNTLGQPVINSYTNNVKTGNFSVNLTGLVRGIYFVTCNFAAGSITRKILLQ